MDRAGWAGCVLGLCLAWLGNATPLAAQRLPPRPQQSVTPAPAKASFPQAPVAARTPGPLPDPLIAGHDLQVGTFYYNRGDYAGALSRFEDAIVNDPTSAEALCRAGDAEEKLKKAAPARTDWQRCLRMASDGPTSRDSSHWANHAHKALAKLPKLQ